VTYDQVIAAMGPHVGSRVRVTHPNGFARVGVLGTMTLGGTEYLKLDHYLCGGEYAGAVRVEVMGSNGRYSEVMSDETLADMADELAGLRSLKGRL
jgi:hypothetical protein